MLLGIFGSTSLTAALLSLTGTMVACGGVYRVAAQAASALCTAAGAGTAVRTSLSGKDALSPVAWVAPEVLAGSLATGVTATPASDVYMLGGLMFEVLTCGLIPYYWMSDMRLVAQVRLSRSVFV